MNLISKNLSQLRRIALSVLLASFATLETTSISAQELGRTITSPFGIARQPSASESGSDGDTFVDPETGEVGHIIRNPFGVANPEGVDNGIDIPDDAGEEVGGIITSPFGVPASDDIDTGVDVIDEDEEYLISLPDDEESEVEGAENVDEVDDETSDDVKELEGESYEATTEKYVPVIDNPLPRIEHAEEQVTELKAEYGCQSVISNKHSPGSAPTLYVPIGEAFKATASSNTHSWTNQNPHWNNGGLTGGVNGQATCSFVAAHAGDFILSVESGESTVYLKVKAVSGSLLLYAPKDENVFFNMEDYNGDGVYDLFVPYYDRIISQKGEVLEEAKNTFITQLMVNTSLVPSAWATYDIVWDGAERFESEHAKAVFSANDKGSSLVRVMRGSSCIAAARIYIVKVNFEQNANATKYGFDKPEKYHPQNDYKTYVSLKKDGFTGVKVTLDPYPSGFMLVARSNNHSVFTLNGNNREVALSETGTGSHEAVFTINGVQEVLQSPEEADDAVSIHVKHHSKANVEVELTDAIENPSFLQYSGYKRIQVKTYTEKVFDLTKFNIANETSLSLDYLNDAFKQIVYRINAITQGSFGNYNPDENGNGKIDSYVYPEGEEQDDELSSLEDYFEAHHDPASYPIVLINGLRTCVPVTITERLERALSIESNVPLEEYGCFFEEITYDAGDENGTITCNGNFVFLLDDYDEDEKVYTYTLGNWDGTTLSLPQINTNVDHIELCTESGIGGISIKNPVLIDENTVIIEPLLTLVNASCQNYQSVVVHELGHFVAGLADTNNELYDSPTKKTVMQWDGAIPNGESGEDSTFFSCRDVDRVETGTGESTGWIESHWDDALR